MPVERSLCVVCATAVNRSDRQAARDLDLPPEFRVMRCPVCGLRWLDPMPTTEEYRLMYEVLYFGGSKDVPGWMRQFSAQPYQDNVLGQRRDAYRRRLARLAGAFPARGTLLDVGLASGEFALMAQQDGWQVAGLDVSASACDLARTQGVRAWAGALEEIDFSGERFDVIHLSHVFEHFVDPPAALRVMRGLMAPGSLLLIEVPNQFDSWVRRLARSARRLGLLAPTRRSIWSIHHPYFYNRQTLTRLVLGGGFELEWLCSHFPERWRSSPLRRLLGAVDLIADRLQRCGDDIELAVRLAPALREPMG